MSTSNGNGQNPQAPATATTIKPTDLRGILKYVPRFQGQIFVIALDGPVIADDNLGNLLVDIAVLRSLGVRQIASEAPTPAHRAYLERVGFKPDSGAGSGRFVRTL